jgi:hypothetical protein
MQGILSGGLLVVAFAALAGLALLMAVRLYRISRPGQARTRPGQPRGARPDPATPPSARLDPATPPHA